MNGEFQSLALVGYHPIKDHPVNNRSDVRS
jgi:hypothetical protein